MDEEITDHLSKSYLTFLKICSEAGLEILDEDDKHEKED